jgi:rfaE bifunctional protein nucleotidyltransferase chain/domain
VVAGGCFDLLHAGHVELLEAARALGDCLIVCLNSDRSIRRLKGPGRPIVDEHDRRRVLEALQCVDAVAVFDESTPIEVLQRLQPHVFAKGADYVAEHLPERAVLARWGGTVAILPLAGGRSTSSLIEIVRERAS